MNAPGDREHVSDSLSYEDTVRLGVAVVSREVLNRLPRDPGLLAEEREARRARMSAALERIEADSPAGSSRDALLELLRDGDPKDRAGMLVELAFTAPFSPYSIAVEPGLLTLAVGELARDSGVDPERVQLLGRSITAARSTHSVVHDNRALIATGVVVTGAVAVIAATHGAAALGAMHGLHGAAAVAYGLAHMPGLGHGMAGGLWLIAATGGASATIRKEMFRSIAEMSDSTSTRTELMKAQAIVLLSSSDYEVDEEALDELKNSVSDWRDASVALLDEARSVNDPGSPVIKDQAIAVKSLERTLTWAADPMARTYRDIGADAATAASDSLTHSRIRGREILRGVRTRAELMADDVRERAKEIPKRKRGKS